jgi:hypothetical protein
MNYSELQREVKGIIMDQSPSILIGIPDYINEAIQLIAEEVKFPELKQVTSVTTSTSTYYISMPVSWSSRLNYAGNSDGEYVVLDGGLEELIRLYPTLAETGDVKHLTLEGRVLYYQPVPATATVITCIGYHTPDILVNDTDTPDFIPEFLHRETVVNKVAEIAYSIIEDGVEGEKVNTAVFSSLARVGLDRVRAYVSRRRPVVGKSNWSV